MMKFNFIASVIVTVVLFSETAGTPFRTTPMVVQVPLGETATLLCESNDENHTFFYWHLTDKNLVIGPANKYNSGKFKFEVLSGNLTVKAVSKDEEGVYECASRGVKTNDLLIRPVRMVVQTDWEEVYNYDPHMTFFRVTVVLGSFMVLAGIGYAGYRIWKTRYRQPSYLISLDDEDDSGEELFSRVPGVPRDEETTTLTKTNSSESFETPGISTDFTSILDNRASANK